MTDDPDPLDGADVGDTATVTETQELWIGDLAHDDTHGSDRFADHRVTDTEVVTDEYGEQVLRVTVASDMTKRVGRNWDREPWGGADSGDDQPSTWVRRATTLGVTGLSLAIGVAVTNRVTRQINSEVTINGEPAAMPTGAELLGPVLVIVAAALVVLWALPRMEVSR